MATVNGPAKASTKCVVTPPYYALTGKPWW